MANSGELNPLQWNYKSVTTYLGVGFGAIMGGVVGAGIATPGSVVFAGGISTPYLSAGLAEVLYEKAATGNLISIGPQRPVAEAV